ncbi:hypothetical protein CXB51_014045 [Gossypium anomalum]|uniref:Uncharacterized protein n=1 Tax=Gossypium anomalum TaxID=47600 RepID=A0A8J5YK17_9ROSI|nr:hypothetical protein CXB51_014045 [Gossypium anomalum]
MVLLEKLWDDVVAGPQPERGLGRLRKITTTSPLSTKDEASSMAMPTSPTTPGTPSTPVSARRDNVWRSVFNPGSNLATKGIGAEVFDKPQPNSPTVYDCNQTEAQRQIMQENLTLCLVAAWKEQYAALQRGDPEQASPLIGRWLTAAEGSKTTSRRLLLLKEQDLHSKRQRWVVGDLMSFKIPAVSGGS